MTATLQRTTTDAAPVVAATVNTYVRRHQPVVEAWLAEMAGTPVTDPAGLLRCVVAIDHRVVEVVVTNTTVLSGLVSAVWRLAAGGWQIIVLAPRSGLGDAHDALRGTPCRLQPWWMDGGEVAFGRFELT